MLLLSCPWENTDTLLPNDLVTLKIYLELIAISQRPATTSGLNHLLQSLLLLRAQWPGTDCWPYPLPPSPWKNTEHPGNNNLLTPKKETANNQTPTPKINSNPNKNTKGDSCIEVALQGYSLASPNSQKKKNTSKMKKLRNLSQLNQQENSPKAITMKQTFAVWKTWSSKERQWKYWRN